MDLQVTLDDVTETAVAIPSGTRRLVLTNLSNSMVFYAFVSGNADETNGVKMSPYETRDFGEVSMTGVTLYATSNLKGCRLGIQHHK